MELSSSLLGEQCTLLQVLEKGLVEIFKLELHWKRVLTPLPTKGILFFLRYKDSKVRYSL